MQTPTKSPGPTSSDAWPSGAAIAASLSVVLFAIVRVRAQNAAQEAEALAGPTSDAARSCLRPSGRRDAAHGRDAFATALSGRVAAGTGGRTVCGREPAAATEARPSRTGDNASAPARTAGVQAAPNRPRPPTARPGAGASSGVGPGRQQGGTPAATGEPVPTQGPGRQRADDSHHAAVHRGARVGPPRRQRHQRRAPRPRRPSAARSAQRWPTGTAGEVPGPASRPRPKKTDDPDSTLPLNLD